jgi:hypothetical protein
MFNKASLTYSVNLLLRHNYVCTKRSNKFNNAAEVYKFRPTVHIKNFDSIFNRIPGQLGHM